MRARHRVPQSAQVRRAEWRGMLALISLPFVLPLYIWFAVRTDNVLLMIGLAIGLWGGMWLDDKRKVRRRRRSQETQRAQL